VALTGRQRQPDASLGDAMLEDQLRALVVNSQPRILQVDRIHRMARDGDDDAGMSDGLLVGVAEDAGAAPARPSGMDAVEVDETHRLVGAVSVRDAGS
jgi:hypothetical protein